MRAQPHDGGRLVRDVDPDDAPFVALSLATACPIWTQDKASMNARGVRTLSTQETAEFVQDS